MTTRRTLTLAPNAAAASKAAAAPQAWVCKPCGMRFEPALDVADDEDVRCPSCNAKLGKAKAFKQPDPETARVRARPATSEPKVKAPAVKAPIQVVYMNRPRVVVPRMTRK
jgi:DNA-directed RNA polymerase subunit RPC12/RpoP